MPTKIQPNDIAGKQLPQMETYGLAQKPEAPVVVAVNDTSYWDDPQRVATWYNVLQNNPNAIVPTGMKPEDIVTQYNYYNQKFAYDPSSTWTDDPNDPMAQSMRASFAPSENYVPPQDQEWYRQTQQTFAMLSGLGVGTVQQFYKQQEAQKEQIAQQQQEMGAWEDLKPWQQTLMSLMSPQPLSQSLEGRPVGSNVLAATLQSGATAAATGFAVSMSPLTPYVGIPLGIILFGTSMYQSLTGNKVPIVGDLLRLTNLPAEATEAIIGAVSLASHDPTKAFENIGNTLMAGRETYETAKWGIGTGAANLLATVYGDRLPGENEVWAFEKGFADPQKLPDGYYLGVKGLEKALVDLNAGKSTEEVYADFVNNYGWQGTVNDFFGQLFLDPLNITPWVGDQLAKSGVFNKLSPGLQNHMRTLYADNPRMGNIIIDALPFPLNSLASKISGYQGSMGLYGALRFERTYLQTHSPSQIYNVPNDLLEFVGTKLRYENVDPKTVSYDNNGTLSWKTKDGVTQTRVSTVVKPTFDDVVMDVNNKDFVPENTKRTEFTPEAIKKVRAEDLPDTASRMTDAELLDYLKKTAKGKADVDIQSDNVKLKPFIDEINSRGYKTYNDMTASLKKWDTYKPVDGKPIEVTTRKPTWFERTMYGVTEDWDIKELLNDPTGSKFVKKFLKLKPTSQYAELYTMEVNHLASLVSSLDNMDVKQLRAVFDKIATGKLDAFDSLSAIYGSPQAKAVIRIMQDAMGSKAVKNLFTEWDVNTPRRQAMMQLQKITGLRIPELIDAIRNNPKVIIDITSTKTGIPSDFMTPAGLRALFGDINLSQVDPRAFIADLVTNHIMADSEKVMVDYYGVKQDPAAIRLSKALKATFTMAILGTSPTLPVYNLINNVITRAVSGVGGYIPKKVLDAYVERLTFGLLPTYESWSGIERDYGLGGIEHKFPHDALDAAVKGKGTLGEFTRLMRKMNDKVPSFVKLTSKIETAEGKRAMVIGLMKTMQQSYRAPDVPQWLKTKYGIDNNLANFAKNTAQNAVNGNEMNFENGEYKLNVDEAFDNAAKIINDADPEMARQSIMPEDVEYLRKLINEGADPKTAGDIVANRIRESAFERAAQERIKRYNEAENIAKTEALSGFVKALDDSMGWMNDIAKKDAFMLNNVHDLLDATPDPAKRTVIWEEHKQLRQKIYDNYWGLVQADVNGILKHIDLPDATKSRLVNAFVAWEQANSLFYATMYKMQDSTFSGEMTVMDYYKMTADEYAKVRDAAFKNTNAMVDAIEQLYKRYGLASKDIQPMRETMIKAVADNYESTQKAWQRIQELKDADKYTKAKEFAREFFGKQHVAELGAVNNSLIRIMDDLRAKMIGKKRKVVKNPMSYTAEDYAQMVARRVNEKALGALDDAQLAGNQRVVRTDALINEIIADLDLDTDGVNRSVTKQVINKALSNVGDPARAIQPVSNKTDAAYVAVDAKTKPPAPKFTENMYPTDLLDAMLYPHMKPQELQETNYANIMGDWAHENNPDMEGFYRNSDAWRNFDDEAIKSTPDAFEAGQWWLKKNKKPYADIQRITVDEIKGVVSKAVAQPGLFDPYVPFSPSPDTFEPIDTSKLLPIVDGKLMDGDKVIAIVPKGMGFENPQAIMTKKGWVMAVGFSPDDPSRPVYYLNGKYYTGDPISDADGGNPNGFIPPGTAPRSRPSDAYPTLEYFDVYTKPYLDAVIDDLQRQKDNAPVNGVTLTKQQREGIAIYKRMALENLAETKQFALARGKQLRDDALLNYSRRYGFDDVLETVMPYQFWFTRTMANWAARIWDKPAWFATYYRYRQAQEKLERYGIPARLRGKSRVYAPYLPEWMGGGLWQDPLTQIFPYSQMTEAIERVTQSYVSAQTQANYIIYDMVKSEEITPEQGDEAVQTHAGEIWERAYKEAIDKSMYSDPLSLASAMMSFAPWITVPYYAMIGKADKLNPLPITRLGQSIEGVTVGTPLEGVGKALGSLLYGGETSIRKATGLNEFGQWGTYYIERELANMVADGTITNPQDGVMAMIEGESNPYYAQARGRVQQMLALRTPGVSFGFYLQSMTNGTGKIEDLPLAAFSTIFPSGLLPEGELRDRKTKAEYSQVYQQYQAGDTQAYNKFFEEHPEYEARLALNREPEERLQQYLVSSIWDSWNGLTSEQKTQVAQAFGQEFQVKFLNKETQNYSAINVSTLSGWAKFLNAQVPTQSQGKPITPNEVQLPQSTQAYTGENTTADMLGWSPETQKSINQFMAERSAAFPDYEQVQDIQTGYYAIPETNKASRKEYLADNPRLGEWWDWKHNYEDTHPELSPYFASVSMSTNKQPDYSSEVVAAMSPELIAAMGAYFYQNIKPSSGAYYELQALWESTGDTPATRLGDSLKDFINYYVKPAFVQ